MNISPVSFGKAVRINGSMREAYDVARLVNEKKVSKSERNAQKQAKEIFDDTSLAPAKVVAYQSHLGNNVKDIYVVSGKEALAADGLYESMVAGILDAGDKCKTKREFEKSCKKIQDKHNDISAKLISDYAQNFEINVTYDKRGEAVKSLKLIDLSA